MIDFKSEDTGQMALIERKQIDDEEDRFEAIDKQMISQGINAGDVNKLQDAGIYTCNGLLMQTKKHLTGIKGLSEAKVDKICKAAEKLVNSGCMTGTDCLLKTKYVVRITTGSQALDELLGGVLETLCITEAFGEFRSGKTQLARTLCVSTEFPINMQGGNGKVAYIDTEETFRPDNFVPISKRFGMDPGAVLDKIADSVIALFRVDFTCRGELAEHQQKRAQMLSCLNKIAEELNIAVYITNQVISRGINAADLKKLQDAGIYTCSDLMMQTKKKGIDSDAEFSIACSEKDVINSWTNDLKMEHLKTAFPDCIPSNMIWNCKDKPTRATVKMELYVPHDDTMEEDGDDDLSDGPDEGADLGANDSAVSGDGDFEFPKEWEGLGGYPIVFSKLRESDEARLYFLNTGEVQDLSAEEWKNCTLLASTCTGWLLFLKGDGRSFLYCHAHADKEYNLPPLPIVVTEDGVVIGQWRADIYEEPGKRNHRVILIAQIQSEEGKQLTIMTNGGRGWVERSCNVADEDNPITAGPIMCTYMNSERRLKYGLVWLQGYNQLLSCSYENLEIYRTVVDEFEMDKAVGIALTLGASDNTLFLYQHNGRVPMPNVIPVIVEPLFLQHELVYAPFYLTLPCTLYTVTNRRGWASGRLPMENEKEDGLFNYDLTFISSCGYHVCSCTVRGNNTQWFDDGLPCQGCAHDVALFLQASLIQE